MLARIVSPLRKDVGITIPEEEDDIRRLLIIIEDRYVATNLRAQDGYQTGRGSHLCITFPSPFFAFAKLLGDRSYSFALNTLYI